MLTWEKLCDAWAIGVNERNPDAILPLLTEDFCWPTSARGPADGIKYTDISNWCLTAPLESHEYESTIYDGEDIVVGTHKIIADGVPNKVLGVAKLRDGKVYELQHMRKPV
jgi:hypothetical protein